MIRTVLGDVAPESLGFTLGHEHLYGQPPAEYAEADLCLSDVNMATAELSAFKQAGGGALVEMTTVDYGRDVRVLKRLSHTTGVHIVAVTGFNKAKFADRYSSTLSEEQLTAWMVTEVSKGIQEPPDFVAVTNEETTVRAGVIKGSSSLNGPTVHEEKVLRAAAAAHLQTGAPVSTHTEKATWALEQAGYLIDHGVRPQKLLIGHLDFRPDLAFLCELASLEVRLGLDQFSKNRYLPDDKRLELVVRLFEAGHGGQVILSGDLARRSYWSVNGGAGFQHLPNTVKNLRALGLSQEDCEKVFITNPQQWLTFVTNTP
jgi:5-phospho-D-xylono-1,4-lactonase